MKVFCILLLIVASFLFASPSHALVDETRRQKLLRIARKTAMVRNNRELFERAAGVARRLLDGCDPNICFALDGSGSIGFRDYENQKEFVLLLTAIIGANDKATFSAVQYGFVNEPISNIDGNAERFIDKLLGSTYQAAPETFVGAGLGFCISQLGRRRGEPAKIVIFGDGGATLGGLSGPLSPASLADFFRGRSPANRVCAVAVNFPSKPPLFVDIVGGERNLVTDVNGWPLILNQLRELIRTICERPPVF